MMNANQEEEDAVRERVQQMVAKTETNQAKTDVNLEEIREKSNLDKRK
jgi:hypothetical protein